VYGLLFAASADSPLRSNDACGRLSLSAYAAQAKDMLRYPWPTELGYAVVSLLSGPGAVGERQRSRLSLGATKAQAVPFKYLVTL